MKLLSCHIENFGKLSNVDLDFKTGLNDICKDNGWGKSTLGAFIRCMFYGLEGSRKKVYSENERTMYQPWNGGFFGGSLSFEVGGKEYTIERDFGKKDKDMTFKLLDSKTGLESKDFSEVPGEEIFGVDRESFMRTAFISSSDIRYEGINSSIGAKVGSVSQKGDLENYDRAAAEITSFLNENSPRRKTGELSKYKESIAQLERDISTSEDLDKRLKDVRTNKEKEEEKLRALEDKNKEIRELSGLKTEVDSLERSLDSLPKADTSRLRVLEDVFKNGVPEEEAVSENIDKINSIQGLISKNENLEMLIETEEEAAEQVAQNNKGRNSISPVPGVLALILGIAAIIIAFVLGGTIKVAAIIIGAVLAVIGVVVLCISLTSKKAPAPAAGGVGIDKYKQNIKANNEDIRRMESDIKDFLKIYGIQYSRLDAENCLYDLKAKAKEFNDLKKMNDSSAESTQSLRKELDAKKEKLEAYLAAHPGLDMNSGSEEFSQEQSDSRNVIARYEHEIQEILEGMDMLQEQKASLAEMKEKQEQLAKQYEIVEKTGEFLQRAKENFVAEYMSPVKDAFDKYYTIMTGNLDPKEFRIDANMNIERKEEGSYHSIEAQSTGYSAMIGLCIRLALLDVMYDNEKPAVVMDDPLSGLDARNMAGAKKFLDEISKDYQVIYLSCR